MDTVLRDIRYGARSLGKNKGFAATVVLTLAVSIGANTATFAIVNSVLLRPLPLPGADAILIMSNLYPKAGASSDGHSSAGDYYDHLRDVTVFEQQAMFRFANQTAEINGTPEQISGMAATPSLFRLLRSTPALGRTFTDEEGEIGGEQKVILSDGLWRQLYGGDPTAVGRQLRLGGRPFTIVGVMAPDFVFINPEVRLWVPLAFTPEQKATHHNNNWYHIGRLKPGTRIEQAQAQVDAVNDANLVRFPQFKEILINAGFHTKVERLQDVLVKTVKPTLYLLWGGALFVLLIAGVNIANLSLARLNLRRKEFATRLALGAGQWQLTRQLVVESVLLALAGGLAGVALGATLLRALVVTGLRMLPRAGEIHVDGIAVLVALAMSVLVGILTALIPLAQFFRGNLNDALHEDSRTGTGGERARRVRQVLVVAQVGLAFVLLVGAGLLLVSFRRLLKVDPGFRIDGIVTASTSFPRSRYPGDGDLAAFINRALDAIRRIPSVTAAGATMSIPFSGNYSDSVILAEGYAMKPGESLISPRQVVVTAGYFETMNIGLVRGRYFDDHDSATSPPVVIVDERLARRFWPDRDPIGRRMYQPQNPNDLLKTDEHTRWLKVVGVVRSVRLEDLAGRGSPVGAYYFLYAQDPSRSVTFAIRTPSGAGAVAGAVRGQIAAIDRELALFDVKTMAERTELSLASRKTSMMLALGFGGLALFLSAVGLYGVLAYLVTQRRREIGIRVALGSTAAGIVRLVLREGLLLVGIGLVLGFAGAAALRKAVENEVYGVRPLDPLVIGSVVALLGAVALAACVLPARRATEVDPVIVLNDQ